MKWILGLILLLLGAATEAKAGCWGASGGTVVSARPVGSFVQRTRVRIFRGEGVRFRLFRRGC